jgi:hypothetical protein
MLRLNSHDIEQLKLDAGYGAGPVTIKREVFDALVDAYPRQKYDTRLEVSDSKKCKGCGGWIDR